MEPRNMENELKILLVDDNELNRSLVQLMLEKSPYHCDAVSSGKEALQRMESQPYELVLMDCQMPIMDGFETTKRIRSMGLKNRPYVIAMTANPLDGDMGVYLEAGMDDYLEKPLSMDALFGMIKKYGEKITAAQNGIGKNPWEEIDFAAAGYEEFKEKNGFDDEIAGKLYRDYFSQLPKMVERMNLAYGAKDGIELSKLAHQLKGSSGMLRMMKMADVCLALELAAKQSDFLESEEIIEKMVL